MKLKSLFILLTLASAIFTLNAEEAAKPVNTVCPVSGEDVDPEHVVAYTKVVGVCCEKCQAKIQKDVAGNAEKIAKIPASYVNSKCPISAKEVDGSTTVAFKGATVAVCCEKCEAKFDASKHGEKVSMDRAANDKCPFSDKAIDPDAHAVVSIQVGLCCGKCAKKFSEKPDDFLAKVFAKAE